MWLNASFPPPTDDEQYLMQYQPYLLQFLQSVTKLQTVDPSVFSFSLKLAGLLAGKEHSFTLLEVRPSNLALLYIIFTCFVVHCSKVLYTVERANTPGQNESG